MVHVAGTNGKGSVCAMIGAALRRAGYKVGVYSSPHIRHWSDSILVNGTPDPAGWQASVKEVIGAVGGVAKVKGKLTAFEAATVAMWVQLRECEEAPRTKT